MNKSQIIERIDLLLDVYRWSLRGNRGLSAGQRICLTMERAKLMAALDEIAEGSGTAMPTYTIPAHLEEKVQHIYKTITP